MNEVWAELQRDASTGRRGLVTRLLSNEACVDIEAGLDCATKDRLLLVRFPKPLLEAGIGIADSAGLRVRVVELERDQNEFLTIKLILVNNEDSEIFSNLLSDLVAHLELAASPSDCFNRLKKRLVDWQRFMTRLGPGRLPESAAAGLAGELIFLEAEAMTVLTAAKALDAWEGPERRSKDFCFDSCSAEVKTTIGHGPAVVGISSEHQLDDAGLPALVLYHARLETGIAGRNLNELVDAVVGKLDGDDRLITIFENKLADYGYFQIHSSHYLQPTYECIATRAYRVLGGFPRLLRTGLPPGISRAAYSLDLAQCAPFEISPDELAILISGDHDALG